MNEGQGQAASFYRCQRTLGDCCNFYVQVLEDSRLFQRRSRVRRSALMSFLTSAEWGPRGHGRKGGERTGNRGKCPENQKDSTSLDGLQRI